MRNRPKDIFQALLVREFAASKGIQEDLANDAGGEVFDQILDVAGKAGLEALIREVERDPDWWLLSLPLHATKGHIIEVFRDQVGSHLSSLAGTLTALLGDIVSSPTDKSLYHGYCRLAICHAVEGEYKAARSALRDAKVLDEYDATHARRKFLRGLIHGAQGHLCKAVEYLERAVEGKAGKDTKQRIHEALEVAKKLSMTQLEDGLFIGSSKAPCAHGNSIQAIMNLRRSPPRYLRAMKRRLKSYLWVPIKDGSTLDPAWLKRVVDHLVALRKDGLTVLVHCQKGRSRSAMVCAAYLMKTQRMTCEKAIQAIQALRPEVNVKPALCDALRAFEATLPR